MNDLARFVQANEPQLLACNVYFTDDGTRMSVLHINPDSAALERHMKVAGPKFPPIGEFIKLLSIDVYGDRTTGWSKDYGRRQRCSAARQCACMTSTPDLLACPCLLLLSWLALISGQGEELVAVQDSHPDAS
jgi:hypothetical protein